MDPSAALRERGLRVTEPRLRVFEAVGRHPHADADTVLTEVRRDPPTVSAQAVYDVLHALTDAGLLRRIEPAGHPARYERRVGDNHHHVACRACGAIADVDCAVGHAPCLIARVRRRASPSTTAEVTYWGLCPACRAAGTDLTP